MTKFICWIFGHDLVVQTVDRSRCARCGYIEWYNCGYDTGNKFVRTVRRCLKEKE